MAPMETFTDHNPLIFIHNEIHNEEQEPEITALEFGIFLNIVLIIVLIIQHIKGKDNIIADTLSQVVD